MLAKENHAQGSARHLMGPTPEESFRAVPATEEGVARDDALISSTHTRPNRRAAWPRLVERSGRLLVVALALVAAFAVDWLLVPSSYPVAAAYGVSLILAAHLLASPAIVAALSAVALSLSTTSNLFQAAPTAALAGNNAGLLAIGVVAFLLARQRKITDATANENARLYGQAHQHERELAILLGVSHTVSSTLELRPLLGIILDQLKTVVDYSAAGIYVGPDANEYRLHEYRGPLPREDVVGRGVSPEVTRIIHDAIARAGPVIVENRADETPLMLAPGGSGKPLPPEAVGHGRAVLWLPILTRGAIVGALGVVHPQPGYYTERHGQLAMAFAQQVGSALENARLYEQAQGRAVLEERQRLARELHDSVSQVLYSIALNTASAAALRASDPKRAAALEHDVHELAGVGLAEMRALIFELRPESLEREGLVSALHKQADAAQARHGIAVRVSAVDEPEVPLAAKEALYRIAQEALQNVAKHADAHSVELALEQIGSEVILRIEDDGRGFDPARSFPGHLGLHSMRERMAGVGGALDIQSSLGRGTSIEARLPLVAAVEQLHSP
jgi:signal transduction histidine kinase